MDHPTSRVERPVEFRDARRTSHSEKDASRADQIEEHNAAAATLDRRDGVRENIQPRDVDSANERVVTSLKVHRELRDVLLVNIISSK